MWPYTEARRPSGELGAAASCRTSFASSIVNESANCGHQKHVRQRSSPWCRVRRSSGPFNLRSHRSHDRGERTSAPSSSFVVAVLARRHSVVCFSFSIRIAAPPAAENRNPKRAENRTRGSQAHRAVDNRHAARCAPIGLLPAGVRANLRRGTRRELHFVCACFLCVCRLLVWMWVERGVFLLAGCIVASATSQRSSSRYGLHTRLSSASPPPPPRRSRRGARFAAAVPSSSPAADGPGGAPWNVRNVVLSSMAGRGGVDALPNAAPVMLTADGCWCGECVFAGRSGTNDSAPGRSEAPPDSSARTLRGNAAPLSGAWSLRPSW
mmetsp:Transcript_10217/g.31543  ORF Transcript_10217/g.31543 Transcript_10217/m.31543 type:complete len:324 (-) Transcript_10217:559-1530(-)